MPRLRPDLRDAVCSGAAFQHPSSSPFVAQFRLSLVPPARSRFLHRSQFDQECPSLANICHQFRRMLADSWPNLANIRVMLVDCVELVTVFGQRCPQFDRFRLCLVEFCHVRANFGRCWPSVGQHRPIWVKVGPKVGSRRKSSITCVQLFGSFGARRFRWGWTE